MVKWHSEGGKMNGINRVDGQLNCNSWRTTRMKLIYAVLLIVFVSQALGDDYGDNNVDLESVEDVDQFTGPSNVTILWREFGFRVVCDEDEWKGQFDSIKSQMVECLEVANIVYQVENEQEFDRQRKLAAISGKPAESPYCWLAKNWRRCLRLMAGLECIEPNPKSLSTNRPNKIKIPSYNDVSTSNDPYDYGNMIKSYDNLCEIAKLQAKSNIFETLGALF